jgi:hypothetical protein
MRRTTADVLQRRPEVLGSVAFKRLKVWVPGSFPSGYPHESCGNSPVTSPRTPTLPADDAGLADA